MLPSTKNSSYNLSSPFILYLCHTLKIYKPKYYKTMAQELEQPIYVKPNRGDAYEFDSGEWKTVSGEFRMFFHIILLIYRGILHVIRNG